MLFVEAQAALDARPEACIHLARSLSNLGTWEILSHFLPDCHNLERLSLEMAGLVTYASSDEEDEVQEQPIQVINTLNVSHCALQFSPE